MWCAKCHADVAAEVSPDNARARCATCGTELGLAAAVRAADKTREARELLERWSNNRTLDPYGPVLSPRPSFIEPAPAAVGDREPPPAPAAGEIEPAPGREPGPRESARSQPQTFRVDAAHSRSAMHQQRRSRDHDPRGTSAPEPAFDGPFSAATAWAEDEPLASAGRQPGLSGRRAADVQSALVDGEPGQTNWFQLAGHLLAYGGALVLTLGTALVLLGYFGGPQRMHFTPTGWLIATFGQLLLVSGVITLVSSGMERSTHEVSARIEALGEKLLRFERAAGHAFPSGPSIPAERFAVDGRAAQPQVAERV